MTSGNPIPATPPPKPALQTFLLRGVAELRTGKSVRVMASATGSADHAEIKTALEERLEQTYNERVIKLDLTVTAKGVAPICTKPSIGNTIRAYRGNEAKAFFLPNPDRFLTGPALTNILAAKALYGTHPEECPACQLIAEPFRDQDSRGKNVTIFRGHLSL